MNVTALIFLWCTLFVTIGNAQSVINWSFFYNKQASAAIAKATLSDGWHIYSLNLKDDAGPIPTSFSFEENAKIDTIFAVIEPEVKPIFDQNFGSYLSYHKGIVEFFIPVKFTSTTTLKGDVLYMLCNDEGCLPPEIIHFSIQLTE